VQGHLLLPLIDGDRNSGYDWALVEHDNLAWGLNMKTLRSHDWRMTFYAGCSFGELYDLKHDPDELVNLRDDPGHQEVIAELKTALLNRLVATEDFKPVRETNY